MKFDIVRAWKDETYRQNLSAEEIYALPANPAGELDLTCDELASVCGSGGGGGYGGGGFGPGIAPVAPVAHIAPPIVHHAAAPCCGGGGGLIGQESFHSLALNCRETVFSLTANGGANFLSPVTTFCINNG